MGKDKAADPREAVRKLIKAGKLKKKCCKSKPRCKKCPVRAMKKAKKKALKKAEKQAAKAAELAAWRAAVSAGPPR